MKRLTKPGAEGTKAFCDGCVDGPHYICADKDTCDIPKIYTALQDYEDTRLTPKEIKSLFHDGGLGIAMRNRDLGDEVARLKQWVNDLQSGMYVNCVYCGHRYGPEGEVPVNMAEVLKQHIEQCPEHPMSKLKAENQRLKEALEKIANPYDSLLDYVNRDTEWLIKIAKKALGV